MTCINVFNQLSLRIDSDEPILQPEFFAINFYKLKQYYVSEPYMREVS